MPFRSRFKKFSWYAQKSTCSTFNVFSVTRRALRAYILPKHTNVIMLGINIEATESLCQSFGTRNIFSLIKLCPAFLFSFSIVLLFTTVVHNERSAISTAVRISHFKFSPFSMLQFYIFDALLGVCMCVCVFFSALVAFIFFSFSVKNDLKNNIFFSAKSVNEFGEREKMAAAFHFVHNSQLRYSSFRYTGQQHRSFNFEH